MHTQQKETRRSQGWNTLDYMVVVLCIGLGKAPGQQVVTGGSCHCILLGHSLVCVAPALDHAPAVAKLQHLLLPVVLGVCALAQAHHTLPMDGSGCTFKSRQWTGHMLSDKHAGERKREPLLSGVCRYCC